MAENEIEYRVVTSSASMPSVVAAMLDRLSIHGANVLVREFTRSGQLSQHGCSAVEFV